MSLALPCVLGGRYEVQKRIGSGGMGEVYLARHLGLDRDVAVKLLSFSAISEGGQQEERIRERFRREAVALSRLRHPNTVQVVDFGWTEDERPYIVTELLTGRTLDLLLRDDGPLDADRALHIMGQICMSLAEAHQHGIVHRDLKPSNVFVTQAFGATDYVKVIDFGVARVDSIEETARNRPLTVEGTTLGTPDYMAPEQARGQKPSPATDVYALGCMLYEMLAGTPPFAADSALQVMIKHIKQEPRPISEVRPGARLPPGLEHTLMAAMKKAGGERPLNAGVLAEMLQSVRKGPVQRLEEFESLDSLGDILDDLDTETPTGTGDSDPDDLGRIAALPFSEDSQLFRVKATSPSDGDGFRRPMKLRRARQKSGRHRREDELDGERPPTDPPGTTSLPLEASTPIPSSNKTLVDTEHPLLTVDAVAQRVAQVKSAQNQPSASKQPTTRAKPVSAEPIAEAKTLKPANKETLIVGSVTDDDLDGDTAGRRWLPPVIALGAVIVAVGAWLLWRSFA